MRQINKNYYPDQKYSSIFMYNFINKNHMCFHVYYGSLRHKRQCKHSKAIVNTGKTKKCSWLHPNYGIHVSYFWSGLLFFIRKKVKKKLFEKWVILTSLNSQPDNKTREKPSFPPQAWKLEIPWGSDGSGSKFFDPGRVGSGQFFVARVGSAIYGLG